MKNAKLAQTAKRCLSFILALILLFGTVPTTALAATNSNGVWDGKGDDSSSSATATTGSFSIPKANDNVYGYRFTVYDKEGNKAGSSVDFLRRTNSGTYASSVNIASDKKSHIDLYDDYKRYGTVALSGFTTIALNGSGYASYKTYYDSSLPKTPKDVEGWLTESSTRTTLIFTYAGAEVNKNEGFYLVCEPLFLAQLGGPYYIMTMAEFAVFQSSQYGWTWADGKMPNYGANNKYSYIMRHLSGVYGRYLYAENKYPVFSTEPPPAEAICTDKSGDNSILLAYGSSVGSKKYNSSADILKYQVGMAIYSKIYHTLTKTETGADTTGAVITLANDKKQFHGIQ